jgi:Na+-transporting methylmalonyl-CoA/oxaloacetate decarboxylase gamma subunit
MSGLYSLRDANRSVKLAAVMFLLVLGLAYVFAFLMVRQYAGLTPGDVAATYVPQKVEASRLPQESHSRTAPLELTTMKEERHQVDTPLLIQDSHIHIMIYAIVAALQTLVILGLGWSAGWRDVVILAAFGSGAMDFAGQWLMKAGIGGFAWLTIGSGWLMTAVYLVVLIGTLRAVFGGRTTQALGG